MKLRVDFTIPEVDVRAECLECGYVCWGDAAVDAFTNWWNHKNEVHPEVSEVPEEPPGDVTIPIGTPPGPIN